MSSSSSSTKGFDRLLGVLITLTCGTSVYFMRKYCTSLIEQFIKKLRLLRKRAENIITTSESLSGGYSWFGSSPKSDDYHKQRYSKYDTTLHTGFCHCQKVKFRIRASQSIRAVDVPSKIRFPRVSIPCQNFEPLTDESTLSFYAIQQSSNDVTTGIYTFCNSCGVHILFSPSVDPRELLINADCLDKSTISDFSVTFHSCSETIPSVISPLGAGTYNSYNNNKYGSTGHSNRQQQQHQRGQGQVQSPPDVCTPLKSFFRATAGMTKQKWRSNATPSTASTASISDASSDASSGSRSSALSASTSSSISVNNESLLSGGKSLEDDNSFFNMWPLITEQDQQQHTQQYTQQYNQQQKPPITAHRMDALRRDMPKKYQGMFQYMSPLKPRNRNRKIGGAIANTSSTELLNTPMQRQLRYHLKQHLQSQDEKNIVV